MALVHPSIADKFTYVKEDVFSTSVSIAVWLIDNDSKKEPLGCIKVRTKEGNKEAVKNFSGYYIFSNLTTGEYNIEVESDLYHPEKRNVDISKLDTKNSVVEFVLKPISSK